MAHSSSRSTVATSPPAATLDSYIHYTAKAAELAREAIVQVPELHARIAELEQALESAKLNQHQTSQRAKDAQRQLDSRETMIACFLDGDGCIFDRSLIRKGRDGGREAALALRSNIIDYAESQGLTGEITVIVTLFLSKSGLSKALQNYGLADESTFGSFLQGLNAAHPLIQVTDVGPQKEAADAKLRENVKLFSKLPSCKLVLAGCAHDGGYSHLFSQSQTESPALFKKLRLLHSYAVQDTAFELKRMNLESIRFEGVFEQRKLGTSNVPYHSSNSNGSVQPVVQRKMTPVSMVSSSGRGRKRSGYTSSNGNVSAPESSSSPVKPAPIRSTTQPISKFKTIDPSKPLNKQAEPLCNSHYLAPPCNSTVQGETCRYSHSYLLTPAQLAQLRLDAQKSPCFYALKGQKCRDGDRCFAGHVCPRGSNCKYGKSCRFLAPGMHPPGTKGRNDRPTRAQTSEEDEEATVVLTTLPLETNPSSAGAKPSMTKNAKKRRARAEARFANYVVQLGGMTLADKEGANVESESDREEDESGYETTSSID
ncbi:hypothetical protein JCM11491_002563 [Sporobolomyces phaffii]